jgi:hypothetical protein
MKYVQILSENINGSLATGLDSNAPLFDGLLQEEFLLLALIFVLVGKHGVALHLLAHLLHLLLLAFALLASSLDTDNLRVPLLAQLFEVFLRLEEVGGRVALGAKLVDLLAPLEDRGQVRVIVRIRIWNNTERRRW